MNKQQFLDQLRQKLASLPESEIQRSLTFYEEIISDRMEEGMTEEAAVAGLGDPEVIAEGIILDATPLPSLVREKVKQRKDRAKKGHSQLGPVLLTLLLVLGFPLWFPLIMVLLGLVLTLYILLWALAVTLFAVLLAVALSAVACVVGSIFLLPHGGLTFLLSLGVGLVLAGLVVLLWFPLSAAAKGLVRLTKALGRKISRGVKSLFR